MRVAWRGTIAALIWLAAASAYAGFARADNARNELDELFTRSSLQIATPDARLHAFDVWVADNDRRRARGLMYVERLDDHEGMLFVYPKAQPISMWMKNTKIPLDMLFVRGDGRVERVVENTVPLSLETIDSGAPVTAVIELKAGTAAKLKIRPGARVIHPAFSRGSGR